MANNDIITKRAITYSVLAHISESGKLAKGQLDVFIPIVKKALQRVGDGVREVKGANISEIARCITDDWQIDIPIPVLRTILTQISKEFQDNEDTNAFVLNNDGSYWIRNFVFADFDEHIKDSERNVKELQKAYKQFCKIYEVQDSDGNDVIRFIEQHKDILAHYLCNADNLDKTDYSLPAKFIDYFRPVKPLYDEIRDLYLGATISCAVGYQFEGLKNDVTLLLDTNFVVSLMDLNTPESTKTCSKLLGISSKYGYTFVVLPETIEEIQSLLEYKSRNLDKVALSKYVNKEDVFCACERRNLNGTDLMRISDNVETFLTNNNIKIIRDSTTWRNKARFSNEYQTLKSFRNNDKAALHDAMAIIYVKDMRGKSIKSFEKVNCWFVNNSITHDFEHDAIENIINGVSPEYQPEIIKADDLLNILWLSTPAIRSDVPSNEMVEMGLTTLVAHTLNKSLPKARIIKELDENIQKYKSEDISDRDVYLLSVRIANNQVKNIESLNELASDNVIEFNNRVKEEARQQAKIEEARQQQLDNLYSQLLKAIGNISKQTEEQHRINESLSAAKRELGEKENELKETLEKSQSEIKSLSEEISEQKERIDRKNKIIVCLIVLTIALLVFIFISSFPIKEWMDKVIKFICGGGGLWAFVSMVVNIVKSLK